MQKNLINIVQIYPKKIKLYNTSIKTNNFAIK